jgi:kynurenine formamidase
MYQPERFDGHALLRSFGETLALACWRVAYGGKAEAARDGRFFGSPLGRTYREGPSRRPGAEERMGFVVRLIDLSQEIYQGMYVYPGHLKTVIWETHSHEETKNFEGGFSYTSRGLMMSDHGPRHVDALNHLDPDPRAPSIDRMDLGLFHGDATCIDVSHKEPQSYISDADLDEAVDRSGVPLREGDILLFYTGTYDRHHGTPEYLSQYPGVDEAASEWIADKGIKTFA